MDFWQGMEGVLKRWAPQTIGKPRENDGKMMVSWDSDSEFYEFYSDLMEFYSDLMEFYSDLMGYEWDVPSGNDKHSCGTSQC